MRKGEPRGRRRDTSGGSGDLPTKRQLRKCLVKARINRTSTFRVEPARRLNEDGLRNKEGPALRLQKFIGITSKKARHLRKGSLWKVVTRTYLFNQGEHPELKLSAFSNDVPVGTMLIYLGPRRVGVARVPGHRETMIRRVNHVFLANGTPTIINDFSIVAPVEDDESGDLGGANNTQAEEDDRGQERRDV